MITPVKCGVRTHAHFRVPELKSGALDRSANLTSMGESETFAVYQITMPSESRKVRLFAEKP